MLIFRIPLQIKWNGLIYKDSYVIILCLRLCEWKVLNGGIKNCIDYYDFMLNFFLQVSLKPETSGFEVQAHFSWLYRKYVNIAGQD